MGICNSGQWDVRRISMYYLSVKQGRVGMSPPFFPLLPWSCRSHVPNGIWHGGGWQLTLHRAWVGLRHWDFDHYLPQHDLAYKKIHGNSIYLDDWGFWHNLGFAPRANVSRASPWCGSVLPIGRRLRRRGWPGPWAILGTASHAPVGRLESCPRTATDLLWDCEQVTPFPHL